MTSSEVKVSNDEEFEYIMFVLDKLIEILKLNFLMITAVISIVSIVVQFINVELDKFIQNNIFMTGGILFWVVALASITVLFIQIKPITILNSSSQRRFKQYERFERSSYENQDLSMISNYLSMCLLTTSLSFLLLIFGIIEAGVREVYNTGLPQEVINTFVLVIALYTIGSFVIVKEVAKYWDRFKELKCRIMEEYRQWRWDPLIQYRHEWLWMNGFDYRILEYLEKHSEQTVNEISSNLLTREGRVRQRIDVLTNKNMIDQSNNCYSLSDKGRKFLYGYLRSYEL